MHWRAWTLFSSLSASQQSLRAQYPVLTPTSHRLQPQPPFLALPHSAVKQLFMSPCATSCTGTTKKLSTRIDKAHPWLWQLLRRELQRGIWCWTQWLYHSPQTLWWLFNQTLLRPIYKGWCRFFAKHKSVKQQQNADSFVLLSLPARLRHRQEAAVCLHHWRRHTPDFKANAITQSKILSATLTSKSWKPTIWSALRGILPSKHQTDNSTARY